MDNVEFCSSVATVRTAAGMTRYLSILLSFSVTASWEQDAHRAKTYSGDDTGPLTIL